MEAMEQKFSSLFIDSLLHWYSKWSIYAYS